MLAGSDYILLVAFLLHDRGPTLECRTSRVLAAMLKRCLGGASRQSAPCCEASLERCRIPTLRPDGDDVLCALLVCYSCLPAYTNSRDTISRQRRNRDDLIA